MKLRMRTTLLGLAVLGLGCGFGGTTNSFPPIVDITSPLTQTVRGLVDFSANVSDDTGVAGVIFFVDGVQLATDTSAPFITTWNTTTLTDGQQYTLRVVAEDIQGNQASASRVVIVNNAAPN